MPEAGAGTAFAGDATRGPAAARPWAVYLLECHGGKSYIGISPSPLERFEAHRAGKGAAFTRANRPRILAAVVWFENRAAAASMEARLKAFTRAVKHEWFNGFAATSAARPATLEDGLASLADRRGSPRPASGTRPQHISPSGPGERRRQ